MSDLKYLPHLQKVSKLIYLKSVKQIHKIPQSFFLKVSKTFYL